MISGLLLWFPSSLQASILLSEVQVSGDKAADEFVELYNTGSDTVNLSDYALRRKSQSDVTTKGSSLKTFGSSDVVPPKGYFLWASSGGIFKDLANTTTSGGLSDNNSLGLFDSNGNVIDMLTWGTGHILPFSATSFDNPEKKESFERNLDNLNWSKTKKISPTNSKGETWEEKTPPPTPGPTPLKSIVINEVFPDPAEKGDVGEFIELYNPLSDTVDLSGWEIRDASTSGKYTFPSGAKIGSLNYLVITDEDFTFSLNNGKEALSLYDTEQRIVHTVSYDKTKEGVTFNLVGKTLRGGKVPTPGQENRLNADPVIKERVPKKGYQDVPVEFSAKGKDPDGDTLKYTWDFGDDRKSYKRETTHTYQEIGKYIVTLTIDDGVDTTTETFEIKIEKYAAPKLRIVALMPNPKGNDNDFEWIEIENREKKAIDLQGFGIATGGKRSSITNHPISDTLTIKGRSIKRLTRKDALFSLNNTKGYVELRAPTGEVIHDLKYKFEKSLADDVIMKKEKGKPVTLVGGTPAETEAGDTPVLGQLNTEESQPASTLGDLSPSPLNIQEGDGLSHEPTLTPAVKGVSTVHERESPRPLDTISPHPFGFFKQLHTAVTTLLSWLRE